MLNSTLRQLLGTDDARSFQLMGEDLALVPPARLREVARAYERALEELPADLRDPFESEQAALLREVHEWLRRYNHSVGGRVAGYLALARRVQFEYPWPVVAILGICQVLTGMRRNRVIGLVAEGARRLGQPALERLVDRTDDVLRRTNRGIFADSVPTVLFGLRARELRRAGNPRLADALLGGPLPLLMDEQSRTLARELAARLAIEPGPARFRALAVLTSEHFEREQAIFTYQMGAEGGRGSRGNPPLIRRLLAIREVPAPVVRSTVLGRRKVVFRPYALPEGFDMRDHAARVREFDRAFVAPVTSDLADYQAAARYAVRRFGKRGEASPRVRFTSA